MQSPVKSDFWYWPRRGRNKSAQGNALGFMDCAYAKPCKGETKWSIPNVSLIERHPVAFE
jgi:hypothetical protein